MHSPSVTPKQIERREEILRAAARCLAERGYDRVRLRDVARACGQSIGALQYYFESREELLEQAYEFASNELIEQWQELTRDEQDPWRRIVALVSAVAHTSDFKRHCLTYCEFCIVSAREPTLVDGVQRIEDAWRGHIADAVHEGCKTGMFQPRRTQDDAVELIMALVDGCELRAAAGVSDMNAQRFETLVLQSAELELGLL